MADMYDVFISHAGEDKDTIAVPLYHALRRRVIRAFLDRDELKVGENAVVRMQQAMESALIAIFILSPHFAAKKWPMDELLYFLSLVDEAERKQCDPPLLIPVFYKLSIQECRYRDITSPEWYGEVFLKNYFFQREEKKETSVEDVRKALGRLTSWTGIENRGTSQDSPDLRCDRMIDSICDEAVKGLRRKQDQRGKLPVVMRCDHYVAAVFVPPNDPEVVLDFDGRDADGCPCTQEGQILDLVLQGSETGGRAGIVSIEGMAGVGKSCVMRGLAQNHRVKDCFVDGIFFVLLGMDATMTNLVSGLLSILSASGAQEVCKKLRDESNYMLILQEMKKWFEGKRWLLLVDDFWERNGLRAGLVTDLNSVFSDKSGSMMVLSTRFARVGAYGRVVKLREKESMSLEAEQILLRYARFHRHEIQGEVVEQKFKQVLASCGGLPFALAAAGRGIAISAQKHTNRSHAWITYTSKLESLSPCLLSMKYGSGGTWTSLHVSLAELDASWGATIKLNSGYTIYELHRALCIFEKQATVSLDVLRRLWGVPALAVVELFTDAGLAEMVLNDANDCAQMRLHDMIHDFAVDSAHSHGDFAIWHKRLLHAYMPAGSESHQDHPEHRRVVVGRTLIARRRLTHNCRPWWRSRDDGYLYTNVCRHLFDSGLYEELISLLMNAQWALVRPETGGALAWNDDVKWCVRAMRRYPSAEEEGSVSEFGLRLVRAAVRESWGLISSNRKEFKFQMQARLLNTVNGGDVVCHFLESLRLVDSGPWLMPLKRCWAVPNSGRICPEVQLGDRIRSIAPIGTSNMAVVAVGSGVLLLDFETGTVFERMQSHTDTVTSVAASPNGQRIVSGSQDRTIRVWDRHGKEAVEPLLGHADGVSCVAISPDGGLILSGSLDCTVRVWDLEAGRMVGSPLHGQGGAVLCLKATPSNRHCITGSEDGAVRLWDLHSGTEIQEPLRVHRSTVECMAMDRDGSLIVTVSDHETIQMRGWREESEAAELLWGDEDSVRCVALSPDGLHIVSGSADGSIRMRDLREGREVREVLRGHCGMVTCVEVSPDGRHIWSGSVDGTLRIWEFREREQSKEVLEEQHSGAVTCVAMSPDGGLIVTGSSDMTVRMWDTSGGKHRGKPLRGHKGAVLCVAVSADSKYVLSGSEDRSVRVWELQRSTEVGKPFRGNSSPVRSVAMSSDAKHVIFGSDDGVICIWSPWEGKQVGEALQGHGECVQSVAISPDGRYIVSVSRDFCTRVWDFATGRAVGSPVVDHDYIASRINISPDNLVILFAGQATSEWKIDPDRGLVKPGTTSNICLELPFSDTDRVLCSGREVILASHGSIVATLPNETNRLAWYFDPAQNILVTGLRDGQVLVHKLMVS